MEYDPHNNLHRQVLAYVYILVVQRECDIFINIWISNRIRSQGKKVQTGIPDHMFEFPEVYGGSFSSNIISKINLVMPHKPEIVSKQSSKLTLKLK